jgi:Na+-translocating ferredoxin:NAD+ oxidoreductase RnfD subunit
VYRAARSDVTYAFLACHIALRFGRALWLGDPFSIPLHQLQNGALVLFAFFMISDPKTTPDTRLGRILFAGLVALGAWYVQFVWYWGNALLWSLAGVTLTVPLLDWLLPGRRYAWPQMGGISTAIECASTPNSLSLRLRRQRAPSLTGTLPSGRGLG